MSMRNLFKGLCAATPDAGLAVAALVERFYVDAPEAEARRFDLALWKMLKRASPALRASVAECLSCLEKGPSLTLRALACDPDPRVALPVLRNARALSDKALAEIARCKDPDHLNAIAERPGLDSKIGAILIRRGTRRVLQTLSMNDTAELSPAAARRLGKRLRAYARPQAARERGAEWPSQAPGATI
jgi:uncharacterized protein (DUF2336 family)